MLIDLNFAIIPRQVGIIHTYDCKPTSTIFYSHLCLYYFSKFNIKKKILMMQIALDANDIQAVNLSKIEKFCIQFS